VTAFSTNGAAEEHPTPRPGSRTFIVLVITTVFLFAAVVTTLAFLTPSTEQDVGNRELYAPDSVTRFAADNYYLVRFESGDFVALYDRDTEPDARRRGCRITWQAGETLGDETGIFRSDCNESAWSMAGELISGPSPRDMDSFDIDVEDDGSVSVDTGRLNCGEGEIPPGGLNAQCLPLRDR
jgi:hypothetical protein